MESAGWVLSQRAHVFTALDKQGEIIFKTKADANGLYFLNNVGGALACCAQLFVSRSD